MRSLDNLSKQVNELLAHKKAQELAEAVFTPDDWLARLLSEQKRVSKERVGRYTLQLERLTKRLIALRKTNEREADEVYETEQFPTGQRKNAKERRSVTSPVGNLSPGVNKHNETVVFQTRSSCQIDDRAVDKKVGTDYIKFVGRT